MSNNRRTTRVKGLHTSIYLEDVFWQDVKHLAKHRGLSIAKLLDEIYDSFEENNNFSSNVRIYLYNLAKKREFPNVIE